MTTTQVVIIGAGGHGREVWDALLDYAGGSEADPVGFLDDHKPDSDMLDRIGGVWLGPVDRLCEQSAGTRYLIGIGSGEVRRRIDERATRWGFEPFTLVHPDASVGRDVRIGPGAVVFARATVTTNITVGRHAHVGRGVAVGHDSTVGDYASIYPNAAVSGNVSLGEAATVGTGACIRQGLAVGPGAMIGCGAAVVADVPAGVTTVGVPAAVIGRGTSPL